MSTETATTRRARVFSKWPEDREPEDMVGAFLPHNYRVVGTGMDPRRGPDSVQMLYVTIEGKDDRGWTLEDYVIPRLASGLYFAEEVPMPE